MPLERRLGLCNINHYAETPQLQHVVFFTVEGAAETEDSVMYIRAHECA